MPEPKITLKDVEHVARLARLDLGPEEKERMRRELVLQLKKGRLDNALRVTLSPDDKLALTQYAALNLHPTPELAAVSGGAPSDA